MGEISRVYTLFSLIALFSCIAFAGQPPSGPDEPQFLLADSVDVGKVQINEVNVSTGEFQFVELYVSQEVTITANWHLTGIGQGNNAFNLACDENWLVMESGVATRFACDGQPVLPETIIFVVPNIELHNNFNEIILTDSNDLTHLSPTLVDYLLYSNNENYSPVFGPENPDSGSIIIQPGGISDLCVIPDGSDNWQTCDPTPGGPNVPEESAIFLIEHDGQGLTCEAEPIVIKACSDASCSNIDSSFNGDVILQVNGNTSTTVTLTDGISDSASFIYVTPDIATLSISADATTQCLNTVDNSASCDVVFADAGLVLDVIDSASCDLQDFQIRAVEKAPGSQQCRAAVIGTQTINLGFAYSSPVSGTTSPYLQTPANAIAENPAKTPVEVTFDVEGVAVISGLGYQDVGELTLFAEFNGSGEYQDLQLLGQQLMQFYPAVLSLSATRNDTDNTELDGNNIEKAGLPFSLSIAAQCNDGTPNPNYQPKSIGSLTVRSSINAPIDPELGGSGELAFAGQEISVNKNSIVTNLNITPADFNLGQYTDASASYSEVGTLALEVIDSDYHSSPITSGITVIGRFTPHHFVQVNEIDGTLAHVCNNFAYTGELDSMDGGAITYLTEPTILIEPMNAQGERTKNYINEFMKLTPASVDVTDPTEDSVTIGALDLPMSLTAQINDGTINAKTEAVYSGVVNYQFSLLDNFVYSRNDNAKIAPFISDIELEINSVIDSDGVSTSYTDAEGEIINAVEPAVASGLDIIYGRWNLQDTVGVETENLDQIMQVQRFNGSDFEVNVDDSCTSFLAASMQLFSVGSLDPSATSVVNSEPSQTTFENGMTRILELAAPNEPGQIGVEYSAPLWLQYNWSGIGNVQENPTATATFGVFDNTGDRVIGEREIEK